MADSSLDDFFAKKDKSKKAKKKFTTTEQIAKKLEESGKKVANESAATKPEKEKQQALNVPTTTTTTIAQIIEKEGDDEWRDFEEEKEKDYSGLKIQNLQITESKDDDFERERNEERDEDGDLLKFRDSSAGPWNKITSTPAPVEEKPPTPPPVVEIETKEEAKPAVYRPPHQRSGAASATSSASKSRHSNKTAPEISSELHFPSLSAAADNTKGSKKGDRTPDSERGFESVKRGSRTNEDVSSRGPKLDLGNKYNALSHSDS